MSTEVTVALIAASGGVLVALFGVLVELVRSRRANAADHKAVLTEVASLHQAQDEMKADITAVRADVKEARDEQREQGERLARIEGRFDDHLLAQLDRSRRR
jgi:hypothetical protein